MTKDFAVDYAVLESTENTLNRLKSQFGNADSEQHAADWGHPRVASAMGSFSSNWSHHRDKLQSSLEAMAKQVHETRTGTQDWDSKTAHAVAPH